MSPGCWFFGKHHGNLQNCPWITWQFGFRLRLASSGFDFCKKEPTKTNPTSSPHLPPSHTAKRNMLMSHVWWFTFLWLTFVVLLVFDNTPWFFNNASPQEGQFYFWERAARLSVWWEAAMIALWVSRLALQIVVFMLWPPLGRLVRIYFLTSLQPQDGFEDHQWSEFRIPLNDAVGFLDCVPLTPLAHGLPVSLHECMTRNK